MQEILVHLDLKVLKVYKVKREQADSRDRKVSLEIQAQQDNKVLSVPADRLVLRVLLVLWVRQAL